MFYIDTHTHLYVDEFKEDRQEMMERAMKNGVQKFLLPNIDLASMPKMFALTKAYPKQCFPMLGLHPCSVAADYLSVLEKIETELNQNTVIAIGEIGIDLYWDKTTLAIQKAAFKIQIEWAKKLKLPIVIHVRDAFEEVFEVLDELNDNNLTGVFHCFTGNLDQAKKALSYGGFKLGLGGVLTFKNSGLDKVIENLTLKDLVLETDSPYLAPTPYRGKRNESAYLVKVAEKLAEIFKVDQLTISEQTNANTLEIFGEL
ncbi:hydrolase TatD [Putridiphycobacter roseus]|uniref:Hydrolase TatD n=1 Tax=Putridiphycobacter roseus TaxID=2219161 RepID=A0A2W1N5N7_9FLAO|nr:TatD family hydrolase [Putridiphycobacter roseus]PZE18930.1 hydrolase TatD [Putridiphycobacter roseus]